jgi:hypothetical protein
MRPKYSYMLSLEKLLSIASMPLRASAPTIPQALAEKEDRGYELYDMLRALNGFFAFESALHVFPLGSGEGLSLESWNAESLWRSGYGEMAEDLFFFAEDGFGHQFAIHNDVLVSFDPEIGRCTDFAPTLEAWAERILGDYEVLTGYPLVHEWQQKHGPILPDYRLAPRIPFVLGGEYSLDNMYLADSVALMRFRGSLAKQLRDIPDGTPVNLKIL